MTRVENVSSIRRLGVLLAGILLLGISSTALAQESVKKSSPAMLTAFKNVVARPSESTIRILCDDKEAALGTILSQDGWILTKASELKGKLICKLKDGRKLPARIVGVEETHDLAMVKIDTQGLRPIEWRESKTAEVGHWLASPGVGDVPVSIGVVSVATRRPGPGQLPLSAKARNSGWLGVVLLDASEAAKVDAVSPGSPAAKAGLKAGDLVHKISGQRVTSSGTMVATIQRLRARQDRCAGDQARLGGQGTQGHPVETALRPWRDAEQHGQQAQ